MCIRDSINAEYGGLQDGEMTSRCKLSSLTAEQAIEVNRAFDLFDVNNDGFLNPHELKMSMRGLGCRVTKDEARGIVERYAPDRQQQLLGRSKFIQVIGERYRERDPEDEMQRAFALFDRDDAGCVTVENLREIAEECGEEIDTKDLEDLVAEFDTTGANALNARDFMGVLAGHGDEDL
eukprot:TRINITY_DN14335_c0_g1_i1.p1 TRINITY_DN14335_c0_g1~~TRINITY_DN14335_c0_g1_i1.p1  ORF type:complete len:179 (-),score=40.75 TRINITY_DN14335_c0_g1_i1:261-797(-)